MIEQKAGAILPSIFTAQPQARARMRDFFSSHIRNANTRRAYLEAVRQFSAFCTELGLADLATVEPIHVAAFIEAQLRLHSRPTVKQRLAALRMLFDWLVVGQVLPINPAHAMPGRSIHSGAAKRRCSRPRRPARCSTPSTQKRSPAYAIGH